MEEGAYGLVEPVLLSKRPKPGRTKRETNSASVEDGGVPAVRHLAAHQHYLIATCVTIAHVRMEQPQRAHTLLLFPVRAAKLHSNTVTS